MPAKMSDQTAPPYVVLDFTFSTKTSDANLDVMCHEKRLTIYLSAENLSASQSLTDRYLFLLQVAKNDELDGYTTEDFYEWVMKPFTPILCVPPRRTSEKPTLHNFLFPETSRYTLSVDDGVLVPRVARQDEEDLNYGVRLPSELCMSWPTFRPSDLEIHSDTAEDALGVPKKVQLVHDPTPLFVKLVWPGDVSLAQREIKTYEQIKAANLSPDTRIPRLHGLVSDGRGLVFGLLMSYIDCRARTLACAAKPHVPANMRHKWCKQVVSSVQDLHGAGIIWGDAKAENVLIDEHGDAWILDFGGGYTEGWVTKNATGTVAGDLEGVANIVKYIGGPGP